MDKLLKGVKKRKRAKASHGSGTLVKRGKVYHVRWYKDGHFVSRSTGTGDLDAARAFAARLSVARKGQSDREAVTKLTRILSANLADKSTQLRVAQIPVKDLFQIFRDSPERRDIRANTLRRYQSQLGVLDDWIARRHPEIVSARDISQMVADEYAADRAKSSSPGTLNKDLNLFAAVWQSLSRRYGLEYNPWTVDKIARKALKSVRRRALTDEEVDALLANSSGELHLMIVIGINTGLRLGDVLNLEWARNIDFERREIVVETSKTGKLVVLPMTDELHDALRIAQAAAQTPYVVPEQRARVIAYGGDTSGVSHSLQRIFKRCGIETQEEKAVGNRAVVASFHSLRHTFVSRLIRRGVNPAAVREAVGHSTMLMTEHYTHIDAETLKHALAPVED